jgi:pimeloyl-ACP methyl ester carboxylesterase
VSAPPIRYAASGDIHLAYQVVGDGPIDLVVVAGAVTNLEVLWDLREYREWVEELAAFTRVILFDKRGMGLSDRVRIGTLEERMDDVRAIMDHAGSESAVLLGVSEGGPMSMLFAATYPERARALILAGAEVKEETTDDWPWGESTREDFERHMTIENILERWARVWESHTSSRAERTTSVPVSGSPDCNCSRRARATRWRRCRWPSRSTCVTSRPRSAPRR